MKQSAGTKLAFVKFVRQDNGNKGFFMWDQVEGSRQPEFRDMRAKIINDLDIQALVDDELDPVAKREVMAAIQGSYTLKTRYEQLLMQKRLIMSLWNDEEGRSLH
jgi:hypothetical protein